ncbi:hypothetical protein QP175_15685 [Sphingomonas aerolata]|uniref:hypothetical protein n=1 Tax=Sphingomonas aerolata TaxID=185951 RepID=UPI002FE27F6B
MPLRPVRPSPSFGWIVAAIMVVLFGAIVVGWRQRQRDVAATAIAVVRAPTIPVVRIRPLPEARPTTVAPVAANVAAAHLRTVYPLLSDVTITCRDDRCTLTATIRPVTGQADLDRRQEMLLGASPRRWLPTDTGWRCRSGWTRSPTTCSASARR